MADLTTAFTGATAVGEADPLQLPLDVVHGLGEQLGPFSFDGTDRRSSGVFTGVVRPDSGSPLYLRAVPITATSGAEQRRAYLVAHRIARVGPEAFGEIYTARHRLILHEYVAGRPVDLAPGSPDLRLVGDYLRRSAEALTGDRVGEVGSIGGALAAGGSWPLLAGLAYSSLDPREWDEINRLVTLDFAAMRLDGPCVVHARLHPGNLLLGAGRVAAVGWRAACFGPAWTDSALLVPHLVDAGHSPAAAEKWVVQHGELAQADEEAVTALAVAVAGRAVFRSSRIYDGHDALTQIPAKAALEWMRHRMAARPRARRTRMTGGEW
ncbi:hypothetical protein [Kitasatospora sp. NPDC057015]|uniref:hypothetical protein n=1 Tax=Kitasatospora sp. NPDC057015 TaxID=3346001 RepID=UPI0036348728